MFARINWTNKTALRFYIDQRKTLQTFDETEEICEKTIRQRWTKLQDVEGANRRSLSKTRDRAYTISIFSADGLDSIGYPVGPLVSRG